MVGADIDGAYVCDLRQNIRSYTSLDAPMIQTPASRRICDPMVADQVSVSPDTRPAICACLMSHQLSFVNDASLDAFVLLCSWHLRKHQNAVLSDAVKCRDNDVSRARGM